MLLAVPNKFQGYWPDYGYPWSDATYLALCSGTAKRNVESENLGRVRLVGESEDGAKGLIGVELWPRKEGAEERAERTPEPEDGKTGFTVERLCDLLEDDNGRERVESVVRVMAGTGIDFLKTGKWQQAIGPPDDTDPEMAEYILLWKGAGVDEGVDVADKVIWKEKGNPKGDPVVFWEYPGVVEWRKGNLEDTKELVAFHEQQPGYMLTKTWGAGQERTAAMNQKRSTELFSVADGAVDYSDFPIDEGVWRLWANVKNEQTETKLWLVTENAISIGSLSHEIRIGKK